MTKQTTFLVKKHDTAKKKNNNNKFSETGGPQRKAADQGPNFKLVVGIKFSDLGCTTLIFLSLSKSMDPSGSPYFILCIFFTGQEDFADIY